jgi:hypothetical protein
MRQPSRFTAASIKQWDVLTKARRGTWTPARPEPFYYGLFGSIANRFRLAFYVFTGKADALFWD